MSQHTQYQRKEVKACDIKDVTAENVDVSVIGWEKKRALKQKYEKGRRLTPSTHLIPYRATTALGWAAIKYWVQQLAWQLGLRFRLMLSVLSSN